MKNKFNLSFPLVPVLCTEGQSPASMGQTWAMSVAFLFALSASTVFALAVPTAGAGFSLYTVVNTLYTTGLGYVAAAIMCFIGATDLPKDWKLALKWITGGLIIGSVPTITTATGLIL